MPQIVVSSKTKWELEALKDEHEFKSLDAVVRYYLDSAVRITGGIFLGSEGDQRIWLKNIRYPMVSSNFMDLYISAGKTIKFFQCLKCGNISSINPDEPIVYPNCGCSGGMRLITIKVEP